MRIGRHRASLGLAIVAILCGCTARVSGQSLTGQIGGTVVDTSKGVLPGVTITVTNVATRITRSTVSDEHGVFVLTNLVAGTYDVTASLPHFKTHEEKGILLTSTERVSLPPMTLEVGGLTDTVTVTSERPRIQTQSGERSAVITAEEIDDTGLRGRDFMGMLKVLPGVIDTSARDAPGWGSVGSMTINGQASFNFSYDGVTNKDTGSNSGNYAAPGLSSIAEVKVQASNFQAEYGRASGATIVVVTKSGSSKFHGSGAFFKRHEALNANSWARRRSCDAARTADTTSPQCQKPNYRYDNTAYTLGGPVLIPGTTFNQKRDKLFFFWSQDLLPRQDPGGLQNSTMPTALERVGDFSQTAGTNGNRIWIKDPARFAEGLACNTRTGGPGCFPDNVIPADRFNSLGRMILNMYPLPNASDPTGGRQYNYQWEGTVHKLRTDQVLRVDWNVRPGTTFYSRLQLGHEVCARGYTAGTCVNLFGQGQWPQMQNSYDIDTASIVSTFLHTFNASTVLEASAGLNYSKQGVYALSQADLDAVDRSRVLPGLPQFFPSANPLNLIPNVVMAGSNALPNTRPVGGFEARYPFQANNPTWDYTVNLTKLRRSHNMKTGLFVERVSRPAQRSSSFNGTISFNANASNPFDTNFGFTNALLGSINQYTESNGHPTARGRFNQIEFFVQDNWRVRRRFTLDFGIRFVYIGPTYVAGQQIAYFDPTKYDPAQSPLLFEAVCPNGAAICSGTTRQGRNPLTGQVLNNTYIGKLVPGSGTVTNGMVVANGTPPAFKTGRIYPSPRFGFAWDVTGSGTTAIRGGFGTNRDRYNDDVILSLVEAPPLLDTMTTEWTTLPQLLNSQLLLGPRAVNAFQPLKPSTVHNWSLNVQRALRFKLTADVAYVGNTSTNVARNIPINSLTPAQLTDPANLDPTQNNTQRVNNLYLRPFRGYGDINERRYFKKGVTYHSVQVSVTRRTSVGLSGSVAYTGSISRGLRGWDWFRTDEDNFKRFTTAADSRPHNLVFRYNYLLPGVSRFVGRNIVAKRALDGWQLSGVSILQGGTRKGFTYGFTDAPAGDLTQGLGGSRVVLICDPNLPRSQRTFDRQFRTECIAPPGPSTDASDTLYQGSALGDEWVSLGYVNHDLTLFKNFRMKHGRNFRVQLETYNLFNSTQYDEVYRSARFDFLTLEQTDVNFGRVSTVRNNSFRVIQLGARFTF